MKDGTTHLAYKPEHAVDLDTGVVVARADPSGRRRRYDDAFADAGAASRDLDAIWSAPSERNPSSWSPTRAIIRANNWPGDRWCLCAPRWQDALEAGQAPRVVLRATHEAALDHCALAYLKRFAVDLA